MKEACSDRNSRVRLENVGKRRVHSRHGLPALGSTRCCNEWNTFSYYFSPCHPGCAYCSSAHSFYQIFGAESPISHRHELPKRMLQTTAHRLCQAEIPAPRAVWPGLLRPSAHPAHVNKFDSQVDLGSRQGVVRSLELHGHPREQKRLRVVEAIWGPGQLVVQYHEVNLWRQMGDGLHERTRGTMA